jgi:hypothetical protein
MILREAASLAGPTARLVISNWQFLNSERLTRHLVDWDSVGLSSTRVDERDALLDWRAEETPAKSADKPVIRYAHQFSLEELDELAHRSGWSVECSEYSDGKEGNLGLYQIWRIVT